MIDATRHNLLPNNTFGISAFCDRFVQVESEAEATVLLPSLSTGALLVIGGGSNLLLTDDFAGVVLRSGIRGISVADDGQDVLLRCGSGEVWDDVVAYAVSHGLHGAENLSLIPGDVGASAVQNIGAYGAEIADIVESVEMVEIATGRRLRVTRDECRYGYRQSRFKQDWRGRFLITYVTYRLHRQFTPQLNYGNIRQALADRGISDPTATQLRHVIIEIRRSKLPDPGVLGNAGSFFTNPIVPRAKYESLAADYPDIPHYAAGEGLVKIPAGWMIEQCGWKGRSLGRAAVYDKQALVLVNLGGASGGEVLALCHAVQSNVMDRFGIELKPEVNIV